RALEPRRLQPLYTGRRAGTRRSVARCRGLCRGRHEGAHRFVGAAQRRCAEAAAADELIGRKQIMGPILLGVVVLLVAVWAMYGFARVDPKVAAQVLRKSGGILALAGAVFLTVRGQVGLAVPLGFAGLSLLGWVPGMASLGKRMHKSTGQTSHVRSDFVEMELDHDTGAMRGRILKGRMEGVTLDALDVTALMSLLPEIDEESRALLMAYLDRREPAWREHADAGSAA